MTICHDGGALHDKFGNGPDEQTFNCMKNGNYHRWSEEENKRRSEKLVKVIARGRRKITSIVRSAYQKVAHPYDLITSQPNKPHNLISPITFSYTIR